MGDFQRALHWGFGAGLGAGAALGALVGLARLLNAIGLL